uniref:TolB family protein n=1 Tax=Segatella copri TaxID=165179 RepID=UPI003FEF15B1
MKFQNILYGAAASLLLLASCAQTHENAEQVDHYPNMYPDYADVTIPVNIAPLNFEIRDKHLTNIETILTIEGADASDADNTLTATSNSQNLKFDLDDWKAFLQKAVNKNVKVQIYSKSDDGEWTAFKSFKWQVVGDSIDPYLTYRLIEPDYEVWNKIQIRQRCVENWKETILTDHHLKENRCMNCHTFGNQNPNLSMVYVRGEGGGAILNRNGKLRKLNLKTANMVSSSVYYGFDPSGRYVTFSTNIIIPAFHANPDKRLEVYDSKSDVYVADLDNNIIISSPLTSDSTKLETFPTFSPNGRYIYYCVAEKKGLKTKNLKGLKYALVRIPFEDRTGTFGSEVDTLYTERSVCHPKISPDGRYCLFTVADYGTFPIWHPEADLRMLDLQTGKIDSLSIVNSRKSDTYHSWSHSGRWFVFASKRDDGLYGKPYFCYFDEHGKAHKPFVLPQREPTFYDDCLKSFNIPELSRGPVPFNAIDVENVMKQEAEKFK